MNNLIIIHLENLKNYTCDSKIFEHKHDREVLKSHLTFTNQDIEVFIDTLKKSYNEEKFIIDKKNTGEHDINPMSFLRGQIEFKKGQKISYF